MHIRIHMRLRAHFLCRAQSLVCLHAYTQVFVGLYIKDTRLVLGFDYFKDPLYKTPLAFDIVAAEDFNLPSEVRDSYAGRHAHTAHAHTTHIVHTTHTTHIATPITLLSLLT